MGGGGAPGRVDLRVPRPGGGPAADRHDHEEEVDDELEELEDDELEEEELEDDELEDDEELEDDVEVLDEALEDDEVAPAVS